MILLGACSPYALRLALADVEHAGRVAGRLYAISTAGSLLGTMLAALVLIPFAGTQRTFLAFAAALALSPPSGSAGGSSPSRRRCSARSPSRSGPSRRPATGGSFMRRRAPSSTSAWSRSRMATACWS